MSDTLTIEQDGFAPVLTLIALGFIVGVPACALLYVGMDRLTAGLDRWIERWANRKRKGHVRYWLHRFRSWRYWRQFEQPGRTVDQQLGFVRRHLGSPEMLWEAP